MGSIRREDCVKIICILSLAACVDYLFTAFHFGFVFVRDNYVSGGIHGFTSLTAFNTIVSIGKCTFVVFPTIEPDYKEHPYKY